jgi:hypothetical protein
MTATRSKKTAAGRRRPRRPAPAHDHDKDLVTFNLSRSTANAIDAALKGLKARQKDRVMEAVDAVGNDVGVKVGRWVEKRFVGNANALLLVLSPILVKGGLWGELRGIWAFLEELGVRIDHKRIVKAVSKELGQHLASHYEEVLASTKDTGAKRKTAQPAEAGGDGS